jgi:hypothetical protein
VIVSFVGIEIFFWGFLLIGGETSSGSVLLAELEEGDRVLEVDKRSVKLDILRNRSKPLKKEFFGFDTDPIFFIRTGGFEFGTDVL